MGQAKVTRSAAPKSRLRRSPPPLHATICNSSKSLMSLHVTKFFSIFFLCCQVLSAGSLFFLQILILFLRLTHVMNMFRYYPITVTTNLVVFCSVLLLLVFYSVLYEI